MVEVDCSVDIEQGKLHGTACLPNKGEKFPTVLMIHGSGELDRNENQKGLNLDVFNKLAHFLAENGIASVRYDKRGCGESSGDFYKTGHFDLVEDCLSWFDQISEFDFVDKQKIYLLGHSEGCIIAPQINLKRTNLAGMILLCPFIESLEDIFISQSETLYLELLEELKNYSLGKRVYKTIMLKFFEHPVSDIKKFIKKIKSTSCDSFIDEEEEVEAKWFRELFTLKPKELFNNISSPVLAISGSKDIQCNPQDAKIIESISPVAVETHIIEDLTHILRVDNGEPSYSSYPVLAKQPLDSQLLGIIGDWLKSS